MKDAIRARYWVTMLDRCWRQNERSPDLVEMIWRSKGWLPPTVGEKMVVSMPSGRYEVRKIEDR